MLGAVEIGRDLDVIRRKLRRRCRRMDGFRGDSTVDRIIDTVLAPLLLDADDETIQSVGDDLLSVFSRPPPTTPLVQGVVGCQRTGILLALSQGGPKR